MLMPIRHFEVLAASHGISGHPWNHLPRDDTGICEWELLHHAERVLQLAAVGGFGHDDAVERPDRVELEFLGEHREVFELLDRDVITEVRQVQRQLHVGHVSFPSVSDPSPHDPACLRAVGRTSRP